MSLSDTRYGDNLARTVIRRLVARDDNGKDVVLEPGSSIASYSIHRDVAGSHVYSIDFETGGRFLRCGLVEFQARTELSEPAADSAEWTLTGTNTSLAS